MIIQPVLKMKVIVILLICSSIVYANLSTKQFIDEWHESKNLKEKEAIANDFLRKNKSLKPSSHEEAIFLNFIFTEYKKLPGDSNLQEQSFKYQALSAEQKNVFGIKASFLTILYPHKKNNSKVEKFFSSLKVGSDYMDQKLYTLVDTVFKEHYAEDMDSQVTSLTEGEIQKMPFENFHQKLISSIEDRSEFTKVRATIMLHAKQDKIINEYKKAINVKYKDELLDKIKQALINEKENLIKYPLLDIYVTLALPEKSEVLLKELLKEKSSNYYFKKAIEKHLKFIKFKLKN